MNRADLAESPEVRAVVERIRDAMNNVSETVADAARAGIVRIGFVSEPERR